MRLVLAAVLAVLAAPGSACETVEAFERGLKRAFAVENGFGAAVATLRRTPQGAWSGGDFLPAEREFLDRVLKRMRIDDPYLYAADVRRLKDGSRIINFLREDAEGCVAPIRDLRILRDGQGRSTTFSPPPFRREPRP